MNVHIRWMIRRDMPEVLEIEQACFASPWEEGEFIKQLKHRNCIGMVAEDIDAERVVGHMVYELHSTRLEVLNFAVHPECHRQGVGKAMTKKLAGKLHWQRRRRVILDVAEDNLAAQLFFHSQGYRAVEILRDRFDNGGTAYQFELLAEGAAQEPTNRIAKYMRREG